MASLRGQDVSRTAAVLRHHHRCKYTCTRMHTRPRSVCVCVASRHDELLQAYELQSNELRCAVLRLVTAAVHECQARAAQAPTTTSSSAAGAPGMQAWALQLHAQLVTLFGRSALRHMTATAVRSAAKPYGAEIAHLSAAFAATVVRGAVASETLVCNNVCCLSAGSWVIFTAHVMPVGCCDVCEHAEDNDRAGRHMELAARCCGACALPSLHQHYRMFASNV